MLSARQRHMRYIEVQEPKYHDGDSNSAFVKIRLSSLRLTPFLQWSFPYDSLRPVGLES